MWLLRTRRPEIALMKCFVGNASSYVQVISVHQGIVPNTLMFRFYKFLGACEKYKKLTVNPGSFQVLSEKFVTQYGLWSEGEEKNIHADESHQLMRKLKAMPLSELFQLIVYLSEADLKRSDQWKLLLRAIDRVSCKKIPSLPIDEAVRFNYCWLGLVGPQIKFLNSFNFLLDSYIKAFKTSLQVPIIISILFFSGVARKDRKANEVVALGLNTICNDEKQIKELSDTEMILISEVAFKTGLKISNPIFIDHLINTVSQDIPKLAKDPAHLVVVVKTLRLNKCHDRNFLKSIQQCLIENSQILYRYNFAEITHLIALYADSLCSDLKFMNYLIPAAIVSLDAQDAYNPFNEKGKGRAKDIARLLWATSYLGLKINEDIVEKNLMPTIEEKIDGGVYKKQLSILIDTVLSLWIMGYKPVNLLPRIFTEEIKKYLQDTHRVRYKKRLQLLSTCISIETPKAVHNANLDNFYLVSPYNPGGEIILKQRPFFRKVIQDVRNATFLPDGISISCENSLPFLNIPGIVLSTSGEQRRTLVNIEVLDSTNCLHETEIPNGLMLLKLRLLRKLGHRIVLINGSNYENQKAEIMLQLEDDVMNAK